MFKDEGLYCRTEQKSPFLNAGNKNRLLVVVEKMGLCLYMGSDIAY